MASVTADSSTNNPGVPGDQGRWLAHPVRIGESSWSGNVTPLVSICCTAYNHERFIRECLDGFLMQETTFPVEVLVHDDASTDGTAAIIREYEARFPALIKPIYQTENQYSKKIKINRTFNISRAKGNYIATCEGDDYWTAPNKLQTQIDFLEAHPDYSGCFHNVNVMHEDGSRSLRPMFAQPLKHTITIEDLVVTNCIPNLSNVYRARLFPELPEWCLRMPIGDWPLHVLNAEHGPIGYIDQIFAVYRVHGGGVWSRLSESEGCKIGIEVAEAIDAHLGFKYTKAIRKNIAYWHYRIAASMSRDGLDEGVLTHLGSSIRNCLFHEDIPQTQLLAMLFKHSCPAIFLRLKQIRRAVRDIRS